MEQEELTGYILGAALQVHSTLGPGLLESVYEVCLAHELNKRGFKVKRQVVVPIEYDGLTFDEGFRIDLLVEVRSLLN
jgi:GxxExxY protein